MITPSRDVIGKETLRAFSEASRFNRWLYSKIEPYVGRNVLEIGSGIGNLTTWIRADRVIATDYSEGYLKILKEKFSHIQHITVDHLDLTETVGEKIVNAGPDTVICSNVLEHVNDDELATRNMCSILRPGGRLLLLVPYSMALYCDYDRDLGHYRRYTRRSVRYLVENNGFMVERVFLFNFFGGISWFFSGKLLRRKQLNQRSIVRFEKLVPIFRTLEIFGTPFGASVICIAKKR